MSSAMNQHTKMWKCCQNIDSGSLSSRLVPSKLINICEMLVEN